MGEAKRKKFKVQHSTVKSSKRFYVYLHRIYYKDTNTYVPVYVGKGTGDRKTNHFADLEKGTHSNRLFQIVFDRYNSMLNLGIEKGEWRIQTFVSIDQSFLYEWEAFSIERDLIKEYGRRDNGTGCLVNLTDGGEGTSGREFTEEQIKILSEGMIAKWQDPAYRDQQIMRINKIDESARLARSKIMIEFMSHPENRDKASEIMKSYMADPANRKAVSDRLKTKWADPEFKALQLAKRALAKEIKNRSLQ